ncbi:MAG: RNA polymerase sigma factor [Planctomycetota bacterium]
MTDAPRIDALLAHSDWIDRLARKLVTDPNEADEVVQEAWLRALAAPPSDDENLRGWLVRVVRRVLSRRRRAAMRRSDHEGRTPERRGPKTPDEVAVEVALQRELSDAVLGLPDAYRDVMLLRYFEDLPPRRIAERLDVPVNTVRSRLQRGTAALRTQLDETHGSRRSWALALVPLASRAAIGEGAATLLGLGVAGTVGATVVIGGVLVLVRAGDGSAERAPDYHSVAAVDATEDDADGELAAPDEGARRRAVPEEPAVETPEREPEPAAPRGIRGTVLEPDGIPAPGVRMRRQSRHVVRWQSGDRGWINGPGGSRKISAADETRAREDAAFARRLLEGLPHQREWRATVLDAPIPGRDVRSDLAGAFAFAATDEGVESGSIEVADPGWLGLARGERTDELGETDTVWIASRAHRIEGRVRASDGAPIERGVVRLDVDVDAALARLPVEFTATDRLRGGGGQNIDGGRFLVRSAPVDVRAVLTVTAPGFRARSVPVPRVLPDPFEVVLEPLDEVERWRIGGRIVDRGGLAAAGVTVAVGESRTTTDSRGSYDLELDRVAAGDDLIAVGAGGAHIRRDLGRGLLDGTVSDRIDLVLDDADGVVTGHLDAPAAERTAWRVDLDDPTLLEFSFSSVEKRAMGRGDHVAVEADGSFRVAGLFDREYTLRLWRPGTGHVQIVRGVRPGDAIEVDADEGLRAVTGVVAEGAGATVAVAHRTFVTADGGGGLFDAGPPASCDDQGRFALEAVPREGALLRVTLVSDESYLVPVELVEDGQVELTMPQTSLMEVRSGYLESSHTAHVEDAGGRIVPVRPVAPGAHDATEIVESSGGRLPLLLVPASARAVVVTRPDGTHEVLDVTPLVGGYVPVRMR